MSDLAFLDEASDSHDGDPCVSTPIVERTPWRTAEIAPGVSVERALPLRKRRTVGAWCFLDLAGPFDPRGGIPMDIGPHPHIGLQTVTWLFDGEVVHRDSLGSHQTIRPDQLNVMTAGSGVVHSEHSPRDLSGGGVHLAQLWIALPESVRNGSASFEHHAELPSFERDGLSGRVLVGAHDGMESPATVHSGITGLDLSVQSGTDTVLPLNPEFEHAAIVVSGAIELGGERLGRGELLYLGQHRRSLTVRGDARSRLMILGGEPFPDEVLMWWNFVGRTREEIREARQDWMDDSGLSGASGPGRFPTIDNDPSPPIPAPEVPWPR